MLKNPGAIRSKRIFLKFPFVLPKRTSAYEQKVRVKCVCADVALPFIEEDQNEKGGEGRGVRLVLVKGILMLLLKCLPVPPPPPSPIPQSIPLIHFYSVVGYPHTVKAPIPGLPPQRPPKIQQGQNEIEGMKRIDGKNGGREGGNGLANVLGKLTPNSSQIFHVFNLALICREERERTGFIKKMRKQANPVKCLSEMGFGGAGEIRNKRRRRTKWKKQTNNYIAQMFVTL